MKTDLAQKSVQAVIWSYIGAVGKISAQLLIQIFLARILGPEIFGQYAAILVVIGFGWLFADSGFGAALIQKKELSDADVGYALGWILLLSSISAGVIVMFSTAIAKALGDVSLRTHIMVCGPIVVLQAISNISASLMRRNLDMKRVQIIQLGAYVFGFGGVAVFFAFSGAGVWSLVAGFLVQTFITLLAGYAVVQHSLRPCWRGDAGLRQFGFGVLGTNLANWAIDNLDRVIIGRQWGIASLGAYSAASNLSRAPVSLLVSAFQSVVFASASRVQEDHRLLRRGFMALLSLVSVATFPLVAMLAMKADFVIQTLYGDQWTQASSFFAAFCVALPCYILLSVTGPMLWAVGASASEFKAQLVTLVLFLTGLIMLANRSLQEAIWLVPCIYLMRFGMVYAMLGQRIQMNHRQTLQAIAGGVILTSVVVLIELVSDFFAPVQVGLTAWWTISQGILEGLVSLMVLRTEPRFFFGADLCELMLAQSSNSKMAQFVSKFFSLKVDLP